MTTQHEIVSDGLSSHNGEYWFKCAKCGKSDWLGSPGAGTFKMQFLNFYDKPCVLKAAPVELPATTPVELPMADEVEALRQGLNALPRFSFLLDAKNNVVKVPDRSGAWINWQQAHELFDAEMVTALLATMRAKQAIKKASE